MTYPNCDNGWTVESIGNGGIASGRGQVCDQKTKGREFMTEFEHMQRLKHGGEIGDIWRRDIAETTFWAYRCIRRQEEIIADLRTQLSAKPMRWRPMCEMTDAIRERHRDHDIVLLGNAGATYCPRWNGESWTEVDYFVNETNVSHFLELTGPSEEQIAAAEEKPSETPAKPAPTCYRTMTGDLVWVQGEVVPPPPLRIYLSYGLTPLVFVYHSTVGGYGTCLVAQGDHLWRPTVDREGTAYHIPATIPECLEILKDAPKCLAEFKRLVGIEEKEEPAKEEPWRFLRGESSKWLRAIQGKHNHWFNLINHHQDDGEGHTFDTHKYMSPSAVEITADEAYAMLNGWEEGQRKFREATGYTPKEPAKEKAFLEGDSVWVLDKDRNWVIVWDRGGWSYGYSPGPNAIASPVAIADLPLHATPAQLRTIHWILGTPRIRTENGRMVFCPWVEG